MVGFYISNSSIRQRLGVAGGIIQRYSTLLALLIVIEFGAAVLPVTASSYPLVISPSYINPFTQSPLEDLSQIGFQFYNQTESFTSCGAGAIGALQIPARPISMPAKFNMSYEPIGRCSTTRVHYLGALLAAKVPYLVNITSTAPVNFMLVKGTGNNSSELSYETYQARTILDKSQVTSFNQNLTVNQTGLYIFVFRVDKALPVATLDFFVRPANVLVVTTTSTTTTNKTVTMISTATTTLRTNITVTSTATIQNNVTSTDTTTFVERVTEPSIYAWALGATVIAAILAVVALRGRKTSISSNYEEK